VFFFFKQKTAYEITTGDWSSDVCSSDIATLALSIVLQTMIMNWDYVGGSRGLSVLRPSGPPFGNYVVFLFTVMVALAVGAVTVARFIERSWIGRGLSALRDNEEAAECMGVPTLRLKLFATTVSGFFLG